ncbi:hypothetical protein F2Q69_00003239 [Brassica cretica]|uniref:Alpha-L-arabinofuranosidase 1 catalytic domain-containing protein n=1 Tax=Brassica cretica TaxID=69181 RepID=A0A8S9PLK7_BRACR|nr:hypothetical protein F2Q69_00003239 [Brassica cretica]
MCLHVVVIAAQEQQDTQPSVALQVNASKVAGRLIPDTLSEFSLRCRNSNGLGWRCSKLGLFTLSKNFLVFTGFEAGGQNTPSNIWPWSIVGDQSSIYVATDRSSPFERNKIALRMDVICDSNGCPSGGVGVYNPGYWGMNIEEGKKYKVAFYVRSTGDIDLSVSLTSSDGSLTLASEKIIASTSDVSKWTKKEVVLEAKGTDHGARLQLTTTKKGSLWIDQVSAMPVDTYKGHGFRNDLYQMMVDIKPRFIRFPEQQDTQPSVTLQVNASNVAGRLIPDTLFGIFFEEINHAGAGGLWAELVSNRGFEAGGQNTPSNIWPWSIVGDQSSIYVVTDRSSPFERNKIALRMDVICDSSGCPSGGVGVYNPGYWGMNIEEGKKYKVAFYVRSSDDIDLSVSLTSSDGTLTLASEKFIASTSDVSKWTKKEVMLEAKGTDHAARLQLTTTKKGSLWIDQVSAMPVDTYKGHGFRNDLYQMMADIKPRFIRFPGGCFVEGEWLSNAFRWKETVGPWEERPGHFGDVWKYWTDDGLGHFEFFLLAEDIGAAPIWVFNNGISHNDEVETASIMPFVQEALDGIEFARGDANSTWGSVRASMGRQEPFELKYVAIGNEDCGKTYYRGNYIVFYDAIKKAYPDIKIISNCDGSSSPLDHPADYYDFHVKKKHNFELLLFVCVFLS